jgi:hypothetical protein
VEILEDGDRRLPPGLRVRQPLEESKELGLSLFRPHRLWWGSLRVGHPEEIENERQDFFEVAVEEQEPPRDLLPGR